MSFTSTRTTGSCGIRFSFSTTFYRQTRTRLSFGQTIIGRTTTAEGSGVMFRKHDIEEVGGFDEALKVFEDKDMYIRLEKAGKKGMHVPCPLYKYEQTPNSLTRGGLSEKETLKCLSAVTKKHYGDNPDEETP